MKQTQKTTVAYTKLKKAKYPDKFPFNPSTPYPEYSFGNEISDEYNEVYEGIRNLLSSLTYDFENFNLMKWNPFSSIIKPGMNIVIKPNFVIDRHPEAKNIFSIITHPSILRAIIDYCWIALEGKGNIIIADSSQANCNISNIKKITRITDLITFYSQFDGPSIQFLDLRDYYYTDEFNPQSRITLPGDPIGSVIINLKEKSEFFNHPNPERFYGSEFNRQECISHHSGMHQEYQVSKTVLNADVFISVPKMKVHKKVGVTLNIKGLVGICTNKNFLIHYCLGSPKEGGDQYPDNCFYPWELLMIKIERKIFDEIFASNNHISGFIYKILSLMKNSHIVNDNRYIVQKKYLDSGNWQGNDSAWRMAVDLLKIIYYADKEGIMQNAPQRKFFSIIDGIIGGENNGPLSPEPKYSGILVASENLISADLIATKIMGFNYKKIRLFSILQNENFDFGLKEPSDITLVSSIIPKNDNYSIFCDYKIHYNPHPGWKNLLKGLI